MAEKDLAESEWKLLAGKYDRKTPQKLQNTVDHYNRKKAAAESLRNTARAAIGDQQRPVLQKLEEAGKTVLPKQEKAIVDKKSNIVVDSMPEKPDTTRQVVRDSLPSKKEEAPSAVTKAASPKKNPVTSTKEVYPQVKNGAYEIVGTQEEHRLRRGETLRGLALRYYGSKDFTVYIVAYNKIANPDVVPEGMVLKMPKLELKRR